jgi:AraC-like DNA-binding protein
MNLDQPLSQFPLVSTNSVEAAENALSQSLASCHIKSDPKRFDVQLNGLNLGRISLSYNRYGADSKVESEFSGDPVFFVVGTGAPTTFRLPGRTIGADSKHPAIIAHSRRMEIERPRESGILVLRTSLPDLEHQLETLANQWRREPLSFDRDGDLSRGAGGSLMRLMRFLASELEADPSAEKRPVFRRSYEELFLSALLSLPHNHSDLLRGENEAAVSPGIVNIAQEYMQANLGNSVTVSDLLRLCKCSRGTLYSAFRKATGYSPREFLTEQRLHAVRTKLLNPTGADSVSSVAIDCGFVHLGRFARTYRNRFGESPSETLKRARLRF